MADRAGFKEGFLTYSYLLLYIALSSGQIFFNKWVLSSKEINFPYPLGLTLLHMVFSSVLCFVLTKILKVMKVEQGMTPEIYATSVVPIGATFAMTLWLGNTAYLYISVAFAQMLKAIMPVAVFILGVAAGLEVMSCRMLLVMSVISFGVLVASYGEININWIGVVYQMGGVVGEALRLIFMEIFVKRKGLKLNPISVMYYVSPCSALCLFVPWIFLEKPKMEEHGPWNFPPIVLVLNCLCTFALNLSVFLVITHTSALTIRVAGVVKDWVVVLVSAILFADTKLTVINLFGYGIAIAGVAAYNNLKLKKEASGGSSDDSERGESSQGQNPQHQTSCPFPFSEVEDIDTKAPELEIEETEREESDALLVVGVVAVVSNDAVQCTRATRGRSSLMALQLQMTWQPSLLSHKRKTGPPLGLKNLGNSCYLNSVLQCLTYTPPLANFCLRNQHSSLCDSASEDRKRECPFCILEKRIVRSLRVDLTLDAPLRIQSCLRIFAEHFRSGRQEDAHEFLRYVIDACHNTCLRLKKLRRKGCDGASGSGNTVVKEIFGGALQSQVKCLSCGNESNKVDEIMDISLDVLHSHSLKDALQKFFQPEVLDGNNKYKCDNCKKLIAAKKQMSILQAPNVLVIQLKRFEGIFGGKIDKSIAFEEVLVLSSFMCKASQDPLPEYKLFGTIVHSGYSPESGHYYAYVKDPMNRWYCCNDSSVSLATVQEVLSEKVYILFFSRTNQRPASTSNVPTSNGVKSSHCNGSQSSDHSNDDVPQKTVHKKSNAEHSPWKDKPIVTSNGKAPSSPRVKFNISASSTSRKSPASINGKVDAADKLKRKESVLTNGNTGTQSVDFHPAKSDLKDDTGRKSRVITSTGPDDRKLETNGLNSKPEISGHKRKELEGTCILLAHDDQSRARVQELKDSLKRDASSVLRSCGYSDKVYSFMRSRKRLHAEEAGNSLKLDEIRKSLITEAKRAFTTWIITCMLTFLASGA
ncbi:hypothetical protein L6164_022772 [Bauhinia variegata]|uniref:Uncharacterized protein n=1 Tax=Bauhinia variegata TaxID=167791 RepID=A0ACB9MG89_BAUVA|nr:hypothetical protein L6164_022772 [Bauhinia variegata]